MEIHKRYAPAQRHVLGVTPLYASVRAFVLSVALAVGLVFAHQPAGAQVAPAMAQTAQTSDAGSVARSLVDAMKENDGARIRSLFAPQASQAYGEGPPKSGAAFLAWLESDIIDRKGQVDEPKFTVNGNEVIVTGQFRNSRGYRAAANFRFVVEEGRIASWQMRY